MVYYFNILIWLRKKPKHRESRIHPEAQLRSTVKPAVGETFCSTLELCGDKQDSALFGGSLLGQGVNAQQSPNEFRGPFFFYLKHLKNITAKQSGTNVNIAKSLKKKKARQNTLPKPSFSGPIPHLFSESNGSVSLLPSCSIQHSCTPSYHRFEAGSCPDSVCQASVWCLHL